VLLVVGLVLHHLLAVLQPTQLLPQLLLLPLLLLQTLAQLLPPLQLALRRPYLPLKLEYLFLDGLALLLLLVVVDHFGFDPVLLGCDAVGQVLALEGEGVQGLVSAECALLEFGGFGFEFVEEGEVGLELSVLELVLFAADADVFEEVFEFAAQHCFQLGVLLRLGYLHCAAPHLLGPV
jgi:hypothetical protein